MTVSGSKSSFRSQKQTTNGANILTMCCYTIEKSWCNHLFNEILVGQTVIHLFWIIKILVYGTSWAWRLSCPLKVCKVCYKWIVIINGYWECHYTQIFDHRMWLTNQKKCIFSLVFSNAFPPYLITKCTQFCFSSKGPLQNSHIPACMGESWMIEGKIVFTQYQMYLLGAVCVFVFTLSGSCSTIFTSPIGAPAFRQ